MPYLRRFVLMLQFMTAIPIRVSIKADREDFGKGLVLAPVVGLVIGILLAGGNYLLGLLFPPLVTAVLTILFYIILTGGLHLDGLGDTADGLFSNRPRERMLEIMKDSRVGTNAVLILTIVVLLDISLLSSLQNQLVFILLLMPVAGRIGSLTGAGSSYYAGTSDGPGRWCVEYCGLKDVLSGLVIYLIIFAAVAWITGLYTGSPDLLKGSCILFTALVPPLSAFILARLLGRKLGGVTGDILGAVCELNQVVFLLAAFLLIK
jgi:adenosylcobinamide-GDP ribazoletransferase